MNDPLSHTRHAVLYLCAHETGHAICEAQLHAHLEALVEGVDVAQVASRDDDPVRHLPVKLLADLYGSRLLTLKPQAVHGIGEVYGGRRSDLLQGDSASDSRVEHQMDHDIRKQVGEDSRQRRHCLVTWQSAATVHSSKQSKELTRAC